MTVALVNQPLMQSLVVSLCKTQLLLRGGELCLQCRLLSYRILAICRKAWARPVPTVRDQQLGDYGGC